MNLIYNISINIVKILENIVIVIYMCNLNLQYSLLYILSLKLLLFNVNFFIFTKVFTIHEEVRFQNQFGLATVINKD